MTLLQRILAAPDDGSLGPLLRLADDTLAPGTGYGLHEHRAVDVVAVVATGELAHRWGERPVLRAGDVGILRAGTGLEHDEVAGDGGARVLQCYLRSARAAPARYEVVAGADGWIDLDRPDARLWAAARPAPDRELPAGFRVTIAAGGATAGERPAGTVGTGVLLAVVWRLDRARPAWAVD